MVVKVSRNSSDNTLRLWRCIFYKKMEYKESLLKRDKCSHAFYKILNSAFFIIPNDERACSRYV